VIEQFNAINPLSILGAITIGLLANTHCLAMCGGISAALGAAGGKPNLAMALSYNLGRILCYALLGAIASGAVASLNNLLPPVLFQIVGPLLRTVAGLLVIAMGLYISGWWMGLTKLEMLGSRLWRHLQPLSKNLLPPRHPGAALLLGALWGLLPCGLIYSTLSWAATHGSPVEGAVLMISFGLGTLPGLLLVSLGGQRAMRLLRQPLLRKIAGVLLIVFGTMTIVTPWLHGAHGDHAHHHTAY
jgi:sulfite exporter TauE/SafE